MIETLKKKAVGLTILSALLVAAFVLPSSALAQDCSQANSNPTEAQYCSTTGVHESGNDNGGTKGVAAGDDAGSTTPVETTPAPVPVEAQAVQESSSSSSLPFTGLDVGVLAIVAVVLGGAGLLLRRMTAPRETQG